MGAKFRLRDALEQAMLTGVLHGLIVPCVLRHIFIVRRAALQHGHPALGAVGPAACGSCDDRSTWRYSGEHTGFIHLHHSLIAAAPGQRQVGIFSRLHRFGQLLLAAYSQLQRLWQGDARCKPVYPEEGRSVHQIP